VFINNTTGNVVVRRDDITACFVQGLLIVFKMRADPDIVYEEAEDEAQLVTLKARTWKQLTEE